MGNQKNSKKITIRELTEQLKVFDPDSELIFGSDELNFNRTKRKGEKLVLIEFNETILNGKIIKHD